MWLLIILAGNFTSCSLIHLDETRLPTSLQLTNKHLKYDSFLFPAWPVASSFITFIVFKLIFLCNSVEIQVSSLACQSSENVASFLLMPRLLGVISVLAEWSKSIVGRRGSHSQLLFWLDIFVIPPSFPFYRHQLICQLRSLASCPGIGDWGLLSCFAMKCKSAFEQS